MEMNLNNIAGFNAAAEEIREVYIERDSLRDEVSYLRKFRKDICDVIEIRRDAHDDTILKALKAKADEGRVQLLADDNQMYRDILDEIKKYFKMTAPHWKYSDVPHFVKTAHEFALEKKEDAEEQITQFAEDICAVLGVRHDMSTRDSILEEIRKLREENEDLKEERDRRMNSRSEFARDILDSIHYTYYNSGNIWMLEQLAKDQVKRLYDGRKKQEEFTEEATSILGVQPGDLTLSDILEALRKLKREEKLDDMNSSIIADLKTERDKLQQDYLNEIGRRKTAETYISDTFERVRKALDLGHIPDGIDAICDEIAVLRRRASCQQALWDRIFWEKMCDIMEMDPEDASPSDVLGMIGEAKNRLISILALNPDATWTDIYDAIKAEQKDHCDLISKSYKMKNELEDLRDTLDKESEDFDRALRKTDEEALRQMRESYISIIKQLGGGDSPEDKDLAWYEHRIIELFKDLKKELEGYKQSYMFRTICVHLGIGWESATLSDVTKTIDDLVGQICELYSALGLDFDDPQDTAIRKIESLQDDRAKLCVVDRRRQHWVRRYKEEHERAVNLDKLYNEWKDKYEAYYYKTHDLSEQNESLMASYMAVKNTAIKQKDILKIVCHYVDGKDSMPDKDLVVRLNEMRTKEVGWDGLVFHYGPKAIREFVDACVDEITEKTREDLDKMLDDKIP